MIQDLRRYPRTPVSLTVTLSAGEAEAVGQTVDMSMGGVFVETTLSAPFGAETTITLLLPGIGSTRLPATVRWTKPGGLGLQFGLMGAKETHALQALLSSRAAP